MRHRFKVDIASSYGIEIALILDNFYFWIRQNKKNRKNYRDGRYWTYNTQEELAKVFPYMTRSSLQRYLARMDREGLILRANYNQIPYDRTCWYSLTEKALGLLEESIVQKSNLHGQKRPGPGGETGLTIPDLKQDLKTDLSMEVAFRKESGLGHEELSRLEKLKGNHGRDLVFRAMAEVLRRKEVGLLALEKTIARIKEEEKYEEFHYGFTV